MNSDPGIVCFRHCQAKSVFCKHIPMTCPVCSSQMQNFIVDPFRIPYPFANATQNPTSIVIRPSRGTFLDDYDVTHDLHVGIVNSNGCVVEFDKNGLVINDVARWTNCVAFRIVPVAWTIKWDETLSCMSKDLKWRSINYNEITMNCFDFVLEFVNNLEFTDLKFASKEDLCEKLILLKIQDAVRYSLLYRTLKNHEYLLSDHCS